MSYNKEMIVSFSAPLSEQDIESKTYGFRANNPTTCAFCSEGSICKKTSRAWMKKYNQLKEGSYE